MLDFPRELDAKLVRQLDLRERVLEELEFRAVRPGAGQLVFVKNPELHSNLLTVLPAEHIRNASWHSRFPGGL